jgi:malonyl-CoA/methylmalonyl-CoA synthetase
MQLADLFAASLSGQAGEPAIEVDTASGGTETLTFGDLDARSNRLARLLTRHGLCRGDRLAVYLANRLEFVDVLLASVKLGLVLVPINILYREREIAHILGDAEPLVRRRWTLPN